MLFSRKQRILLSVLHAVGGECRNTDFMKYLFLFSVKQVDKTFNFVPYKFGCFSFEAYHERVKLIELGLIDDSEEWRLSSIVNEYDYSLKADEDRVSLWKLKKSVEKLSGRELLREVYLKYPYYAINSEITDQVLSHDELLLIDRARPSNQLEGFFSIGYEGMSLDEYINILLSKDIRILIDVRRNPLSRKYGFSRKTLENALGNLGIAYEHMPTLGIDSEKRAGLLSQRDYDLLFVQYEGVTLKNATRELALLHSFFLNEKRVALTCFEENPAQCHRTRILKYLVNLYPELRGCVWDLKKY